VVTLFHVLEHLQDPVGVLRDLHAVMAPRARLVVETPHAGDWLYGVPAARRHLLFSEHLLVHTAATLSALLTRCGFGPARITGLQRYGLANHMGWLLDGEPGGHVRRADRSNPALDAQYAAHLASRGESDTLWCVAERC